MAPAPAPLAPASRPTALTRLAGTAPAWSLAETLDALTHRGLHLRRASTGLKLAHGHRLPEVVANVARHEAALTLWLGLGGDAGTRAVAPGWDPATRFFAAWLLDGPAPDAPLEIGPGHRVSDGAAYRRTVAGRLALGPDAPGADALRADLAALFARYGAARLATQAWAQAA